MTDLQLTGALNFMGTLDLAADGGKVLAENKPVLIEQKAGGQGSPVLIPPQSPLDDGTGASISKSFNTTVTANGGVIVTMGVYMQGNNSTWPGLLLPSNGNVGVVAVNHLAMNVEGDRGVTLPNGASVTFDTSGQ